MCVQDVEAVMALRFTRQQLRTYQQLAQATSGEKIAYKLAIGIVGSSVGRRAGC